MPDSSSFRAGSLMGTVAAVWSCGFVLSACQSDSTVARTWAAPDPATAVFNMGEEEHRNHAINHPLPIYPESSLREGKEGVAVAAIVADRDGRVEDVELLEAPDEAIGRAVQEALVQWTFHPGRVPAEAFHPPGDALVDDRGTRVNARIASRMTFYFRILNGGGVVLNPAEAAPAIAAEDVRNSLPDASVAAVEVQDLRGLPLDEMFGAREPVFVDIRERGEYQGGHYPGSVNIPVSELETRVPRELAADRFVVILCPDVTAGGWRFCTGMAQRLARLGFEHIGVLPNDSRAIAGSWRRPLRSTSGGVRR